MAKKSTVRVTASTGNVCRDLGFSKEESEHLLVRADLLRVTQPRVSDLLRGRIDLFSTDALIDMLASLRRRQPRSQAGKAQGGRVKGIAFCVRDSSIGTRSDGSCRRAAQTRMASRIRGPRLFDEPGPAKAGHYVRQGSNSPTYQITNLPMVSDESIGLPDEASGTPTYALRATVGRLREIESEVWRRRESNPKNAFFLTW
jgi:hypothetical protein